jgi:hypothetical protein
MIAARWKCLGIAILACILAAFGTIAPAFAAGPGTNPSDKFLASNVVEIPSGQTVDHDLYVSGSTVRIDGRINGDLFVLGGNVSITGPVSGDLFVVGGTVNIGSAVDRHLRILGGEVTVNGNVRQDLLAAAGGLTIGSAAHIGGDLIFGAGQTTMDGTVDGSVLGSAQSYTSSGHVGGSEQVTIRQTRQREQTRETPAPASWAFDQLRRFVETALIGVLLVALLGTITARVTRAMHERPWPSLGIGALAFLSYFALMAALLVILISLGLLFGVLRLSGLVALEVLGTLLAMGLVSFVFAAVLAFVAAAVTGLGLGRLLLRGVTAPWARSNYVALLIGIAIVVIVTAIPFVGGIVNFAVILFGLGAIVIALWPQQQAVVAPAA